MVAFTIIQPISLVTSLQILHLLYLAQVALLVRMFLTEIDLNLVMLIKEVIQFLEVYFQNLKPLGKH
ncbi:MAG: hypothetical protein CMJ25_09590 [Phycisphaerae bacterium]|nr:hypothetical protein [Phycisphaerae bacterium]